MTKIRNNNFCKSYFSIYSHILPWTVAHISGSITPVELIHQVIGKIIQASGLESNYLDEDDPWKEILSVLERITHIP
jgi:hypothetical protein